MVMNLDNSNDIPRLVKRNGEWFQLNGHGTTRLVKGLKQPGDIIYFDGPIDVQIADVLKSEANGAVYRVTHVPLCLYWLRHPRWNN
jgi:hypothetical protein